MLEPANFELPNSSWAANFTLRKSTFGLVPSFCVNWFCIGLCFKPNRTGSNDIFAHNFLSLLSIPIIFKFKLIGIFWLDSAQLLMKIMAFLGVSKSRSLRWSWSDKSVANRGRYWNFKDPVWQKQKGSSRVYVIVRNVDWDLGLQSSSQDDRLECLCGRFLWKAAGFRAKVAQWGSTAAVVQFQW